MKIQRPIPWFLDNKESFLDVKKCLQKQGFTIQARSFASLLEQEMDLGWMKQCVTPQAECVLLSGRQWSRLERILSHRKNIEKHLSRTLAWIWMEESLSESDTTELAKLAVDDIMICKPFHATYLVERLRLSKARASQISLWQGQAKEQSIKDATRETAIGQREEFLSVCAHDLRSPVGLVKSSLSLILSQYGDQFNDTLKELIHRCQGQVELALRLIGDLLDVMSFEQGLKPKYEFIELHEFLKNFHKSHRLLASEKGIEFKFTNSVPKWNVIADGDRLSQVLSNLFTNALKYSPPKGTVYLDVQPFKGRRANDPNYPMLVISVRDEGEGIPADKRESIFNRFSQIKNQVSVGGHGLGLSVAKQISQLHAGNVWVTGEPHEGAQFNLLLPHAISQWVMAREPQDPVRKVLIVETNEARRTNLRGKLERWGYEPLFARDGVDAVVQCFYQAPHMLLFPSHIARMGEGEVAELLRKYPQTRSILLFHIFDPTDDQNEQNHDKFDANLAYPLAKPSFERAIERAIEKEKEALISKKMAS